MDQKPKRSRHLKRLSNIRLNPAVSVLVDRYDEDWSLLWWIRVDGQARVVEQGPELEAAINLLVEKYEQYTAAVPTGPVVWIEAARWSSWEAAGG